MHQKSSGFTLVELMVVIAILGILFAIVVLSYGSWRQMTAVREVTNDLTSAASAMNNYRTYNNGYPGTIPTTFTASPNVTVTYGSGSQTGFCLNGVSTSVPTVKYKVTNMTAPITGTC